MGATVRLLQKEGKYRVAINLEIKEGWHIHHDMPNEGLFILTKVEIDTPKGVEKKGELMHSNPVPYEDLKETTVFERNMWFLKYSNRLKVRCVTKLATAMCAVFPRS